MKLDQQVCSLELAKRLKELNCKQESAFWWVYPNSSKLGFEPRISFGKCGYEGASVWSEVAAFTVAELGEMLPKVCWYSRPVTEAVRDYEWRCDINHGPMALRESFYDSTEANARAKMLCYLIEQGIVNPQLSKEE